MTLFQKIKSMDINELAEFIKSFCSGDCYSCRSMYGCPCELAEKRYGEVSCEEYHKISNDWVSFLNTELDELPYYGKEEDKNADC